MMTRFVICVSICLCLSLTASAAMISAVPNGADRRVSADGSMKWPGSGDMRVGKGSTVGSAGVFVFELPVLPAGETVDSADFAFSVIGGNNWRALHEKGMDLYAVRMSDASNVLATDYYKGPYDGDASATAIEDYIVYETEELNQGAPGELGRHDTDADGETALGDWLADQYADASYDPAGTNYVFLRLSARDDLTSDYRYWSVASADNGTEADRPALMITTIPEPATLGLLALGGLALLRRRR
ncbi:MAG: PEP-CTERM sorting domain-containing protein [Planctomycetota bacterium]